MHIDTKEVLFKVLHTFSVLVVVFAAVVFYGDVVS
jgi:hypothetical protein